MNRRAGDVARDLGERLLLRTLPRDLTVDSASLSLLVSLAGSVLGDSVLGVASGVVSVVELGVGSPAPVKS